VQMIEPPPRASSRGAACLTAGNGPIRLTRNLLPVGRGLLEDRGEAAGLQALGKKMSSPPGRAPPPRPAPPHPPRDRHRRRRHRRPPPGRRRSRQRPRGGQSGGRRADPRRRHDRNLALRVFRSSNPPVMPSWSGGQCPALPVWSRGDKTYPTAKGRRSIDGPRRTKHRVEWTTRLGHRLPNPLPARAADATLSSDVHATPE
jgi:hypothetical protein